MEIDNGYICDRPYEISTMKFSNIELDKNIMSHCEEIHIILDIPTVSTVQQEYMVGFTLTNNSLGMWFQCVCGFLCHSRLLKRPILSILLLSLSVLL